MANLNVVRADITCLSFAFLSLSLSASFTFSVCLSHSLTVSISAIFIFSIILLFYLCDGTRLSVQKHYESVEFAVDRYLI